MKINSAEKFKAWCEEKHIPYKKLVPPIDRLLLQMGMTSHPIILWSFLRASVFYSFFFTIGFVVMVELIFRIFFEISPLKVIPGETQIYCVGILIAFGPFMGFFHNRVKKKYNIPPRSYFEASAENTEHKR